MPNFLWFVALRSLEPECSIFKWLAPLNFGQSLVLAKKRAKREVR